MVCTSKYGNIYVSVGIRPDLYGISNTEGFRASTQLVSVGIRPDLYGMVITLGKNSIKDVSVGIRPDLYGITTGNTEQENNDKSQ